MLTQQAQVGAYKGEGIVDLMSNPGGKFADRGESTGNHQSTAKCLEFTQILGDHHDSDRRAMLIAQRGGRDRDGNCSVAEFALRALELVDRSAREPLKRLRDIEPGKFHRIAVE